MCWGVRKLTGVARRMQWGRSGSLGSTRRATAVVQLEDVGGLDKDGGSGTNDKTKGGNIRGDRTW